MGLIHAALGSASGVVADQWKEYFYCEALPNTVLATKGKKKSSLRGSNNGVDNIISSGSVIAVADGQCMLIVEQGKIVDVCAEPGSTSMMPPQSRRCFPAIWEKASRKFLK